MRWITRLEITFSIGFVLGCLGALAVLANAAVMAFTGTANGVGVNLNVPGTLPAGMLAEGAAYVGSGAEVLVRPVGASPAIAGLYLLDTLPAVVTGLLAVGILIRVLRQARSGDRALFSAGTAGHLRTLGWVLIAGSIAAALLGWLAKTLLSSMLLAESFMFQPLPGGGLIGVVAGAAALGIAEIVRRGLALLQEVEATI
ncbi:DUF2975 domain-containing protein [Nonomuraea endophytica]|uniref:DUF2975 domain-containing protein n=1 Tax=Nonomuraea endophytica TaxID=714136 RepID=UPI0037CC26D1